MLILGALQLHVPMTVLRNSSPVGYSSECTIQIACDLGDSPDVALCSVCAWIFSEVAVPRLHITGSMPWRDFLVEGQGYTLWHFCEDFRGVVCVQMHDHEDHSNGSLAEHTFMPDFFCSCDVCVRADVLKVEQKG